MKYNQWLDIWLENYVKPTSKIKTYTIYKQIVEKRLKPRLGEYDLNEISPVILQCYVTELLRQGNAITGTGLTIGNGVTSIGISAFKDCSLIEVIWNAENCTKAGSPYNLIFRNNNLKTVTIGDNVKTIPSYAFYGCSGLKSVTIGNSVTSIDYQAFYGCNGLTSITIPNSVTSIDDSAFYSCIGLTSVTIGNGVTYIGDKAFYDCRGLSEIRFNGTISRWNAISKGDYWKFNVSSSCKVICTDGEI